MSPVTFGGLASGLDTGSLIDQLVAAERSAADRLATKQTDLTAQKSIISSLSSAVASLGNLARGMDLVSEVRPMAATASDARITVATSSSAAPGTHAMRVKQLAQAQVTSSKAFATNVAGAAGTGGVDITVGGVTKTVTWTATDTLDSIATKITDAGAGVSASVQFDGTDYRIVTVANNSGTTAAPTFTDSGSGLDLSLAANVKIAAQNSIVTVDGIDITRPTNVVGDALAGVTLTLNSVPTATDPNTSVTIAQDTKAIAQKLKDFVAAYNAVNSALHVQLDYTGTKKGTNTLFGDSTLRQLQSQLGSLVSSAYGSSNLGVLGISRDKTGAMTLDESKLTSALATDPNAVSGVFVTNGFATQLAALADNYTTAGTGFFAAKTTSLSDRGKVLQTRIDRINNSADALKTRLERQFADLESAMSALQTQSASMRAML